MDKTGTPTVDGRTLVGRRRRMKAASEALTLRIPYWLYDAGFFKGRQMSSVLQVFLCLVRYMDWHSGNGRLGRAKIAVTTGIRDRETLAHAFARLQQWGLIKVWWQQTGRGCIRYYNVAINQAKMRENAVTYLKHKLQTTPGGYVSGNSRGRGAGKSRPQCSSIIFPKEGTALCSDVQPHEPSFKTTVLAVLERQAQRAQ